MPLGLHCRSCRVYIAFSGNWALSSCKVGSEVRHAYPYVWVHEPKDFILYGICFCLNGFLYIILYYIYIYIYIILFIYVCKCMYRRVKECVCTTLDRYLDSA